MATYPSALDMLEKKCSNRTFCNISINALLQANYDIEMSGTTPNGEDINCVNVTHRCIYSGKTTLNILQNFCLIYYITQLIPLHFNFTARTKPAWLLDFIPKPRVRDEHFVIP